MKIIPLFGASFEANSYLLVSGNRAALVDAGADPRLVKDSLAEHGATLDCVLLTHGHFDHTLSVDPLREAFGVPILIHEDDAEMLADAEKDAFYHFFGTRRSHNPPDETFTDGAQLNLGDETITVLHTPGHSRGSVCFLCGDALLCGDTLFANGYGRYDLHGGDAATLFRSLSSLKKLEPTLTIYPGHGGTCSLGAALDRLSGLI